MATIYWNPTTGSSGGAGTFADPKNTLANASTAAGASGNTRLIGAAKTAYTATWTNGSANVVFTVDAGLATNDWIRADATNSQWYRVESYDAPSKTAVISLAWYLPTAAGVTTWKAGGVHTLAATQALSVAGQTHTVGWTADGVQGGMNVLMQNGARNCLEPGYSGTFDLSVGELLLGFVNGAAAGAYALASGASILVRVIGTLFIHPGTSTSYGVYLSTNECELDIDELRSVAPGNPAVNNVKGNTRIRKLVAASNALNAYVLCAQGGVTIGEIYGYGGSSVRYGLFASGGSIRVGSAQFVGGNDSYKPKGLPGCVFEIGSLSYTAAWTPYGHVSVGGPLAEWMIGQSSAGVVTKSADAAGRGGTGRCWVMTAGSVYLPVVLPLKRPIPTGKTVTLKFWSYYTGTTAPACFVRPIEPNGLTVADTAFTPQALGGGGEWTQHSITFGGTTLQNGSLQVGIYAHDNAAGDAILYVDDVTWVLA